MRKSITSTPRMPRFEPSEQDLKVDPSLKGAIPGRCDLAYAIVQGSHKAALDEISSLDSKAASLIGWVAAVLSVLLLKATTSSIPQAILLTLACLLLFVAIFLTIRVHRPCLIRHGVLNDPMHLYEYQTQDAWDHSAPNDTSHEEVSKRIAADQTMLKVIQNAQTSLEALRTESKRKARLIRAAYQCFGVGLFFIGLAFAWGQIVAISSALRHAHQSPSALYRPVKPSAEQQAVPVGVPRTVSPPRH